MKSKPLCFVIMGFGKKTDFETGKTLDLDRTYLSVIKPAAVRAGYNCVRADEINDSGLIDKSMYALLIRAELVVADISTYNPNALYELGVRHAARPRSTIIIKDKAGKIPFDIDHTRIFPYEHLGQDIGAEEAERCINELSSRMQTVLQHENSDSPLYELMPSVRPPELSEEEFLQIVGELATREDNIYALSEAATRDMAEGRFDEAFRKWQRAAELSDGDSYFVQQAALTRYKSKSPSALLALSDALGIINQLDPENSNDPETLGITGAIYKNMFTELGDHSALDRAITLYRRGFVIVGDYYTGENYANCLNLQHDVESNADKRTYLRIEANKTRSQIVEKLKILGDEEIEKRTDAMWIYGTLSNCQLALGKVEDSKKYEQAFMSKSPLDWEIDTFKRTQGMILRRLDG